MSNGLAIAAVTATLRNLLIQKVIPDVTARPLDLAKVRDGIAGDQLNLFLYHAQLDVAWRNMDMPKLLKPGETGHPPLPLNLFYLLTAYSDDKDEVKSHKLLGRAMSVLHDHPLLDSTEITDATQTDVEGSDLQHQVERVRITFQPLSLEEISKLWSALQTQYRTSAAYQVSVVLIESTRSAKTPLPVLKRGQDDQGVTSQASVDSPFPTLLAAIPPNGQPSVRLGEILTVTGLKLDAGTLAVRLTNPRLADPGPITMQSSKPTEIEIELTDDETRWVAGLYTMAVEVTDGADVRTTNELPLTLAPRIISALVQGIPSPLPLNVVRDGGGTAEITLQFTPQFRPGQRAVLLIGDREVPAEPLPSPPDPPDPTDTLTFVVKNAPVGEHCLRLRIDGVDSLLVQRPPGQPPVFDASQKVTIT